MVNPTEACPNASLMTLALAPCFSAMLANVERQTVVRQRLLHRDTNAWGLKPYFRSSGSMDPPVIGGRTWSNVEVRTDKFEISELLAKFCDYSDYCDYEALAGVYAENPTRGGTSSSRAMASSCISEIIGEQASTVKGVSSGCGTMDWAWQREGAHHGPQ